MSIGINMAEAGMLPDSLVRYGIRQLLRQRLRDSTQSSTAAFIDSLGDSPVAVEQPAANRQHYEVPADFYELVLGKHLKYSSCWFEPGVDDLDQAEAAMLALSCQRAGIENGQEILDVGCGWGSLSLWMAEHYPASRILGISNSVSQRSFILDQAESRGLRNLDVVTADLATWRPERRFDRLVSIECLEHMRNYRALFERFGLWLEPGGAAFIHVFCHSEHAYPFETEGEDNWMGRHFFTGGQMPSWDLFSHFDDHLQVARRWPVNGRHYGATAKAWLDNMDEHRSELMQILGRDHGSRAARRMFYRWRMFFMACEELFNYGDGQEWFVGHYLLRPR